jgi:hypothetical protein
MGPTLANRVARRHLHAWSKEDGIIINVFDDSPPHAPINIDHVPPELDRGAVIDFLAGVITGRGWEVAPGKRPHRWEGSRSPREFFVVRPGHHSGDDHTDWDGDSEEHIAFLRRIMTALEEVGEFAGEKLVIISES